MLFLHVNPCYLWSQRGESNPVPADYESAALPGELRWQMPVKEHFFRHFCCDFLFFSS